MSYYVNVFRSQYGAGTSAITRSSGCTWTSAANGVDASTGGRIKVSPDYVKGLVARSEETNPVTPGWSMGDVAKAMKRLSIPFATRSGQGWAAVRLAHDSGLYIILQGDSDQFSDATCSGAFDGDHAIGVHPAEDSSGRWRIDDPICKTSRYETEAVLRRYAEKLYSKVYFGVFTTKVPQVAAPDTSTEAKAMKFNPSGAIGTATVKTGGSMRRVSDSATVPIPSTVTTRSVYGTAIYGTTNAYLVTYNGEAHLLSFGNTQKFTPKSVAHPYTKASQDFAVAAAVAAERTRIRNLIGS